MVLCGLGCLVVAVARAEPVVKLEGDTSYILIEAAEAPQLPVGESYTLEGWFKPATLAGTLTFYSKNTNRTQPYSHMFAIRSSGTVLSVYCGNNGTPRNGWVDVTLDQALVADQWYHIAFSFESGTMSCFVDGEFQGSAACKTGNYAEHSVKLGGYSNKYDFQGLMSEMRLWERGRSGAEIRSMMNWRLPPNTAGLHAYWPLNEGSGTNVYDQANNVATGSFVNVSWEDDGELTPALPTVAPFYIVAPPVLAANKVGARYLVYTNEVAVMEVPVREEYDRFQVTAVPSPTAISGSAWMSLEELPQRLNFVVPESESESVHSWYFWFTNSSESVVLGGSAVEVTYVPGIPLPPVAIFSGGSYDGAAFDEAAEPLIMPGPQIGLSWGADRLLDVRGVVIEAEDITITESLDGEYLGLIKGNSMTLGFPAQAELSWDITSLTYGGAAAAKVGSAVVSEDGSAIIIPLLADFATAESLVLQGLKIRGGVWSPQFTSRLRLDYDSNGVWDSYDEFLMRVGMRWPGGSYDGAAFDEAAEAVKLRPMATVIFLR
ncbi:MAG: LamG domain-containing protein [Lentisphaerae bacterium]|nr:LamG domain-containing protein [Lentisphaerota bacterium]